MTAAALLHAAAALPFMGRTEYNLSRVSSKTITSEALRDLPAIRVGVSLQLDCCSPQSRRGRSMWDSWQLLVSYVNDVHGGIFVDGQQHRVEIIAIGDYSIGLITASNIQLLLGQGVRIFLGPFGSEQSQWAAAAVDSAPDAILMATAASATDVFKDRPRVFGVFSQGESYFAPVVQKFAASNPSCAILIEDFGPAQAWGAGAKADIQSRGMTLLSEVIVRRDASEAELEAVVSEWVVQFTAAGVSPLLFMATYEVKMCIMLARAASRQRLPRLLMVFTDCVDKFEFAEEPTEVKAYVAGVAPWDPKVDWSEAHDPWTNASAAEYLATFESFTGKAPDYVDAAAYGGFSSLLWALHSTGTTDVPALQTYLQDHTHPTVYGELNYDANRQNKLPLMLTQYQWQPDPERAEGGSFVLQIVQGRTQVAETLPCIGQANANYAAGLCEDSVFSLAGVLILSMSVLLVLMLISILISFRMQRARKRARLLLYVKSDNVVRLPPLIVPVLGFHIFLSHVWVSGQDQMRILKQRLLAMMPEVRVFLDVDDLRSGRGGDDIDRSNMVLVFISSGYFSSQNCMRELLRAVATGKPVVTVCETSADKGALTRDEVMASLRIADRRYHEVWGDSILAEEARKWLQAPSELCPLGLKLCTAMVARESVAEELDAALYGGLGPIGWTRVQAFQNVTIRLIAERILTPGGTEATYIESARAQERRVVSQKLNVLLTPQQEFHLFYSPHNAGALELIREASSFFEWKVCGNAATGDASASSCESTSEKTCGPAPALRPAPTGQRPLPELAAVGGSQSSVLAAGTTTPTALARSNSQNLRRTVRTWGRGSRQTLRVTADTNQLTRCRQMLVYLNGLTWTSGERSARLAADVKAALDAGVDLLLVHETPDVHGACGSKHGVDFGQFLACADGATPPALIQADIYRNVAVPLKDGPFRAASMVLLADNIAQYEKLRRTRHPAQTHRSKWGRFCSIFTRLMRPDLLLAMKSGRPALLRTRMSSQRTTSSPDFADFT